VLAAGRATEAVAGGVLPPPIASIVGADAAPDAGPALALALAGALDDHVARARRSRADAVARWLQGDVSLSELGRGLRRGRPVDTLVYKEPFLAFCPEYPYEAVPGSRLVILHRDGRDVAHSLVSTYDVLTDAKLRGRSNEAVLGRAAGDRLVPWWVDAGEDEAFLAASPYVRAIWMWRAMARRVRRFVQRDDVRRSGRVHEVAYEALVEDRAGTAAALLAFTGSGPTRTLRRRLAAATPQSIGAHRARPAAEIAAAERLAAEELHELGYL
jgi:hypothetical protein